ncbi:MAG TPA: polysaccharide deacetylase family protein [Firmicutes bacterium]|nr:polysaccharide deacetylase family protein [Candidatus Fermentithermobacillaceae bacterium]
MAFGSIVPWNLFKVSRRAKVACSVACVFLATTVLGSDTYGARTSEPALGTGQPAQELAVHTGDRSGDHLRFYRCFLADPGYERASNDRSYKGTNRSNNRSAEGFEALSESSPPGREDLQRCAPNELGKIMIVMYHDIQSEEKEWVRSRDNFRKDLERFYREGFVLIRLSSYLRGEIPVPAGKTPLILTFDDATPGQFRFVERDGELIPDPNCAVGILLDFSRKHPDFGCAATFFIDFPAPFGVPSQVEAKLRFLLENGMEIGNHTYNHRNLRNSPPEQIAEEIGKLTAAVKNICGYEVCSLALPFGAYPQHKEVLASGVWEGVEYRNLGVLLVGAEPAPSPFSKHFKPLAIPRIRGCEDELSKWLEYFRRNPQARFISDGNADTITIAQDDERNIDRDRTGGKTVIVYSTNNGDSKTASPNTSSPSVSPGH